MMCDRRNLWITLLGVSLFISATALGAQSRRAPQPEDVYRLTKVSEPRWSQEGIVFVVTTTSEEEQKDLSHLWWLAAGVREPRQLTFGDHSNYHPRFFPDGHRLAFLSDRGDDDKVGLYVIDLLGGEARPLITTDQSIADFALSRDCKYAALVLTQQPQADILAAMEKAKETVKDEDVLVIDRADFKYDGKGFLQGRRQHLWLANLTTGSVPAPPPYECMDAGRSPHPKSQETERGKLRQLTSGKFDVAAPCFSFDGHEVFFETNLKEAGVTYNTDIFAVPADNGNLRQLTSNPAADGSASVSPDGKWLAYLAAERARCYYDRLRLWIMRPDGTGRRCLTSELDRSVSFEALQPPVWSADGTKIYVLIEDQASVRLIEITVTDGKLRYLTESGRMIHSFDADGSRAVVVSTDLSHPTELHELDLRRSGLQPLTHFNDDWLASVQLARIERFRFESAPGININGWVLFPATAKAEDSAPAPPLHEHKNAGRSPHTMKTMEADSAPHPEYVKEAERGRDKLPGILRIHGGPQWFYGSDFFLDFHVYAMAGYALFFCNPRGSTTYGAAFSDAIRGDWGNVDYHDLMAATDYALKTFPQIDSTRLGVMGWSYGGIMTAWITSHTQRFKAAVCGAPVVDYIADYGESDSHVDSDYEFFGPPWEQAERYRKMSPLTYVANVRTPTLLAHGDEDYRCAIANSERWYISLKRLGVETVFLRYPGESHLFSRPAHNVHFDQQALKWFNRFLRSAKN